MIGPESTGFGLGGRRLSPLVGRELELRFLIERLDRARDGLGQVVWITGEPGVGKSRLLFEFRQRLTALGVPCLEGRCASHGADVPYYLLHDLLQRAWDLPEDAGEVLPALQRRLEALGLGDPDSPAILAQWLGAPADLTAGVPPEALRQRAFDVLRQILMALSKASACVLLEDLHWVDQGSDEFLIAFVDHMAASRLLVVLSARSGHVARLVDRSFVSRLALPPLSREDSALLARAVLGSGSSSDVVARVVERSGGNPFFLEELLCAIESGGGGGVPDTVTAALMARMDRLDARYRTVLEVASVLGREFSASILASMLTSFPQTDLSNALEAIVRLEFLHLQPGATYVFKHALTQEIAYSRLALSDRRRYHAAAGRAFEALAPHRLEELAHHWDRSEDHTKAIDYAVRFVDHAVARYALNEAVNAVQRALFHCDALPDGPERDQRTVTTAMRVAVPLTLLGRAAEIKDVLHPYIAIVERLADPRLSGPYFLALMLAADHTADHDAAEASGARAIDEARRCGDRVTEGRALVMLTFSSLWASEHRTGVARAQGAIACLDLPAEAFWRGHAIYLKAQHHLILGELDAAHQAAHELRSLGQSIEDRRLQAYGHILLAIETMMRGDAGAALAMAHEALEIASEKPPPTSEGSTRSSLVRLRP